MYVCMFEGKLFFTITDRFLLIFQAVPHLCQHWREPFTAVAYAQDKHTRFKDAKRLSSNPPRKNRKRKLLRFKNKTISRLSNKPIKIKQKLLTENDWKNALDAALGKLPDRASFNFSKMQLAKVL